MKALVEIGEPGVPIIIDALESVRITVVDGKSAGALLGL